MPYSTAIRLTSNPLVLAWQATGPLSQNVSEGTASAALHWRFTDGQRWCLHLPGALRVIIDACLLQDVFPGIWRSANIFLHLVGLCSSCYTSKYYRTSKDPESFYINRNQYIMGEPDSGTISRPLNRPLIHQESSNLPQWGPYTLKKNLHFLYNCNAIRL